MDYCYACRRHLNGAYSCPGCGTPADRLALPSVTETAQLPPVAPEEPYDPAPPGGGRAERRAEDRRRASRRARRGRHRAAVYGIGTVAVAGALAMFSVAALSGGSDGGSDPTTPVGHDKISSSGDATPDDPSAAVDAPASVSPVASSSSPGSPSAKPTTTKPTASHSAAASTTQAPPPTTTHTPTTAAPPPPTRPAPTHTTCKPVLWWCSSG